MKTITKIIEVENEGKIDYPILPHGAGWQSTEREELLILESGNNAVLLTKIQEAIGQASHMICLQSFLLQDTPLIDSLLQAVKRGVKVFVLSSAEARLKDTIEEEQDFIKQDYIKLLENKIKNHFVHRVAKNVHAKYVVIDPKTNPKGFICTNNFTENGFLKNPELAVALNEVQCQELFKIFVYHFWECATDEQNATREFEKVKSANKFELPALTQLLLTSPTSKHNTLHQKLSEAVQKAQNRLSFSTFQLDKNIELIKNIIEKAKNGVEITLFCRPIEKQFKEHLKPLIDAGVRIYFHELMHAKSLLIDDKHGFVFTANLTQEGLEDGLEVGIELNQAQTKSLAYIHNNWKENLPYQTIREKYIKEISRYFTFFGSKLVEQKIKDDDAKVEKKVLKKVSDLITFFQQARHISDKNISKQRIKLVAEIPVLPSTIQEQISTFKVLEVQQQEKTIKALVINAEIDVDSLTLHDLEPYKELSMYAF